MIFYVAIDNDACRQLCGTQADARQINKNFEQIDIPTDKAGLMAFVQALYSEIDVLSANVTDLQPYSRVEPAPPTGGVEPKRTGYTEYSLKLEEEFEKLPLAHQLHFAAKAMENAREQI